MADTTFNDKFTLGEVYKKTHLGPMDIGGDVVTFQVLIFMKIESRGLLQLCKQMIFLRQEMSRNSIFAFCV
jgi:hypothetical protein